MKIVGVRLLEVAARLLHPFRASTHAADELKHVVVRLEDEGGLVGWGECATLTDPFYLGETNVTAWHVLEDFIAPLVLGKAWSSIEEFAGLYREVKGNTFPRAGIEIAAWDLLARAKGVSVAELLGGTRSEILSGVSLGIETDRVALVERVRHHVEGEGYRRVKLKITPGFDLEPLSWVRESLPTVSLMADANAAYRLADASALAKLDRLDLAMIEQPLGFDDLREHAELARKIRTPICLDESIRSANTMREALLLGAAQIVNIKVAKVGGLLEAKRIHDLCLDANVPVWCGGMHDYGIGRAANVALSSLPGFSIPGDVSGFDKYFALDVVEPPIVAIEGAIAVPYDRPGLGVSVNEALVEERSTRRVDLRA